MKPTTVAWKQLAPRFLGWLERRRWQCLAVTLPAVLVLHLVAAGITIGHSNRNFLASDQIAEIWMAEGAKDEVFPRRTDGVRHPLWSWMAARFFETDKDAFFVRGKWLNTALVCVFLCLAGAAAARWLDPLATLNFLLLCSLGIFVVRGTYFQPEPSYYLLLFLSGFLAWRILRGGGAAACLGFGAACGFAFLAKPSLVPFLLCFAAGFAVRVGLALRRGERFPWSTLGGLAGAAAIFALIVLPLGRYSADVFGKPFFSYTKYWMWTDDFQAEAYPFQVAHSTRASLEALKPEDAPSPANYFKRHSAADAFRRLTHGAGEVTKRFFFPEPWLDGDAFFWRDLSSAKKRWQQPIAHRGIYLLALVILCGALAWPVRRELRARLVETDAVAIMVFLLCAVWLYTCLYGWYLPVGRGDRFMGSLWVPAVFLAIWAAFSLRRQTAGWRGDTAYLAVHGAILLSLALQVAGMFWRFSQGVYLVTKN